MKLLSPSILLVSGCALVSNYVSCTADQETDTLQTFRQPKNIAFSVFGGGSSHANWVLSIVDELSKRGHSTTFVTKDEYKKLGQNFPSIDTVSLGGDKKCTEGFKGLIDRKATRESFTSAVLKWMKGTFEEDYTDTLELFKAKKIDVAICDHFCISCQEASITLKIPFIVTSSVGTSLDSYTSYTNNDVLFLDFPSNLEMTLLDRIHAKIITPFKVYLSTRKLYKERKQQHLSLGIKNPVDRFEKRWKDSVKMFNTAFGLETARPLGPLVEFIGPIIPKTALSTLTEELDHYLKNHQRVAYIAFGQHAMATEADITSLLAGLLETYETGEIDGILWATRGVSDMFPKQFVTQSNTTYNVDQFFQQEANSDIVFLNWAPQTAILEHSSTSLFVTHCGAGSLHEGVHAGKRLILFPFFGDQPVNAIMAEKNGLGLKINHLVTSAQVAQAIQRVAKDAGGFFQSNVDRFQALFQIKNKTGVNKGADLVEEVAFTHQGTIVHHRRDVKHDLSLLEAYNLDVYALGVAVVGSLVYAVAHAFTSWIQRHVYLGKIKLT